VNSKTQKQSKQTGFRKTRVFKKSPAQWVFWVLLGFLDKQEKIGKIIQKLLLVIYPSA